MASVSGTKPPAGRDFGQARPAPEPLAANAAANAVGLAIAVGIAAVTLFLLFVARPFAIGLSYSDDGPGTASGVRYTIESPFARQGVAVSAKTLYAISDYGIQALDRRTGRVVAEISDASRYRHLNSCIVRRTLVCAHSNFPDLPMASSIETFDLATLQPIASHRLAERRGSLTWIVPTAGGWLACFANYDGHGGAPGRDHNATLIALLSPGLATQRTYHLPQSVLDRVAPHSASGGTVGRGGLLYVTGHDRPEAYVLAMPSRGDVLRHVATIPLPTGGQSIAFDPVAPLLLWSVDRSQRQLVASLVPAIDLRRRAGRRHLSGTEAAPPEFDGGGGTIRG